MKEILVTSNRWDAEQGCIVEHTLTIKVSNKVAEEFRKELANNMFSAFSSNKVAYQDFEFTIRDADTKVGEYHAVRL